MKNALLLIVMFLNISVFAQTDPTISTDYNDLQPPGEELPPISGIVTHPTPIGDWVEDCQDGSIQITISGGVEPYEYLWSNGSTEKDINNLGVGSYAVTVTDNSCGTAEKSFDLDCPNYLIESIDITSCSDNQCNGKIFVEAYSQDDPWQVEYTLFSEDNGWIIHAQQLGNGHFTNLCEGNYKIKVGDPTNFFGAEYVEKEFEIICCDESLQISVAHVASECNGQDGSVSVTIEDNNPSIYRYTLSNGNTELSASNEHTFENLSGGSYTVEVKDMIQNCIVESEPFYIQHPEIPDPCFEVESNQIDICSFEVVINFCPNNVIHEWILNGQTLFTELGNSAETHTISGDGLLEIRFYNEGCEEQYASYHHLLEFNDETNQVVDQIWDNSRCQQFIFSEKFELDSKFYEAQILKRYWNGVEILELPSQLYGGSTSSNRFRIIQPTRSGQYCFDYEISHLTGGENVCEGAVFQKCFDIDNEHDNYNIEIEDVTFNSNQCNGLIEIIGNIEGIKEVQLLQAGIEINAIDPSEETVFTDVCKGDYSLVFVPWFFFDISYPCIHEEEVTVGESCTASPPTVDVVPNTGGSDTPNGSITLTFDDQEENQPISIEYSCYNPGVIDIIEGNGSLSYELTDIYYEFCYFKITTICDEYYVHVAMNKEYEITHTELDVIQNTGCGECDGSLIVYNNPSISNYDAKIYSKIYLFKDGDFYGAYDNNIIEINGLCEGEYQLFGEKQDSGFPDIYHKLLLGEYTFYNITDKYEEDLNFDALVGIVNDATSCTGGGEINSGSIQIRPQGEYKCINYNWETGETTSSISNLAAGTYTVTVTFVTAGLPSEYGEEILEFDVEEVDLVIEPNFEIYLENIVNPSVCGPGGIFENGSATVSVVPSGNYSFLWEDGTEGPVYSATIDDVENKFTTVLVTDMETLCSKELIVNFDCCGFGPWFPQFPDDINLEPKYTFPSSINTNDGALQLTAEGLMTSGWNYIWKDEEGNIISNAQNITGLNPGSYTVTAFNGCGSVTETYELFPCDFINVEDVVSYTTKDPCYFWKWNSSDMEWEVDFIRGGEIKVNFSKLFQYYPDATITIKPPGSEAVVITKYKTIHTFYNIAHGLSFNLPGNCFGNARQRIFLDNQLEYDNSTIVREALECSVDGLCDGEKVTNREKAELRLLPESHDDYNMDEPCKALAYCPIDGSLLSSNILYGTKNCYDAELTENGCILECNCEFDYNVQDKTLGLFWEYSSDLAECERILIPDTERDGICTSYIVTEGPDANCKVRWECNDGESTHFYEETVERVTCSTYQGINGPWHNYIFCGCEDFGEYDYFTSSEAAFGEDCEDCPLRMIPLVGPSTPEVEYCEDNPGTTLYDAVVDEFYYVKTEKNTSTKVTIRKTIDKTYRVGDWVKYIELDGYTLVKMIFDDSYNYYMVVYDELDQYFIIKYTDGNDLAWIQTIAADDVIGFNITSDRNNNNIIQTISYSKAGSYFITYYSLDGQVITLSPLVPKNNYKVILGGAYDSYTIVQKMTSFKRVIVMKEGAAEVNFEMPSEIDIVKYFKMPDGSYVMFFNYSQSFVYNGIEIPNNGFYNGGYMILAADGTLMQIRKLPYFESTHTIDVAFDTQETFAISYYYSQVQVVTERQTLLNDADFCPVVILMNVTNGIAQIVNEEEIIKSRDNLSENEFKVFPNPFTESINITIPDNIQQDVSVRVYTVDGRTIKKQILSKDLRSHKMSIDHDVTGVLYIEFVVPNGEVTIKKIIKL